MKSSRVSTERRIAVALSGGGHRATLFAIGVLLALVDLGLNKRVVQIASVSGGSITNAFVALRCRFEEQTRDKFDPIAKELIHTIINKGVLTKRWLAVMITIIFLPPAAFMIDCVLGHTASIRVVLQILCAWLALILLRGLIVEKLLSIRYFREGGKIVRFQDLIAESVEHVICATDLVHGRPCYFSSWQHGHTYLRTSDPNFQFSCGTRRYSSGLPLHAAVRASAGFPGIPPKRLSLKKLPPVPENILTFGGPIEAEPVKGSEVSTVYLSDGGIWNNLATQPLLEDRFFRGEPQARGADFPKILIVANGSAALRVKRSWPFCIPGWAEIRALVRAVNIQNTNTVIPRVVSLKALLEDRVIGDRSPNVSKPLPIIADLLQSTEECFTEWSVPFSKVDSYPLRSRERRDWEHDLARDLSEWFHAADVKCETPDLTILQRLVRDHLSKEPPPRKAEGYDRIDDLRSHRPFTELIELSKGDLRSIPTTLGRIPKSIAASLIARGYANTFAAAFTFELVGSDALGDMHLTRERLHELTA